MVMIGWLLAYAFHGFEAASKSDEITFGWLWKTQRSRPVQFFKPSPTGQSLFDPLDLGQCSYTACHRHGRLCFGMFKKSLSCTLHMMHVHQV